MSDIERALGALRAADAAGNVEDARRLAALVRQLQENDSGQEGLLAPKHEAPQGALENIGEGFNQLWQGVKAGNAGIYHTLGNLADLGSKAGLPLDSTRDTLRSWEQRVAPKPEDVGDSLAAKINQGLGSAPSAIAQYGLAGAAGGPLGMAGLGAVQNEDQGLVGAAKGALEAGAMGKVLQGATSLTRPAQVGANALYGGATAAAEGGDATDITAGAVTQGGLSAITPGGSVTAREAAKDAVAPIRQMASPEARAENIIKTNPRNAALDAEITQDLKNLKAGQPDPSTPVSVMQVNQLRKSYMAPVAEALRQKTVDITPAQQRQIEGALKQDRITSSDELANIREIPQIGYAAAGAIEKAQRLAQVTKQTQSETSPILRGARFALDLAPIPTAARLFIRPYIGAGQTREQVINDQLTPRNLRTQEAVAKLAPRGGNPVEVLKQQTNDVLQSRDDRSTELAQRSLVRREASRSLRQQNRQEGVDVLGGSLAATAQHTGLSQKEVLRGVDLLRKSNPELEPLLHDLERNRNLGDGLYPLQERLAAMADKGDLTRASPSPNDPQSASSAPQEDHLQGIRNKYSYRQTMENVQQATQNARDTAPTEALRGTVEKIADARTPEEKRSLFNQAVAATPDHKDWLSQTVEPLTNFGPKTKAQPLETSAISRDSRGRPLQRVPLSENLTPVALAGALEQRGFSRNAAAGIAANAAHESGGGNASSALRSDAKGDGGHASGLLQWNGPRQRALEQFARERGKDWTDTGLQLDFLDHELVGSFKGLREKLNNASSPQEAARLFVKEFERPADMETNLRVRAETAGKLVGNTEEPSNPAQAVLDNQSRRQRAEDAQRFAMRKTQDETGENTRLNVETPRKLEDLKNFLQSVSDRAKDNKTTNHEEMAALAKKQGLDIGPQEMVTKAIQQATTGVTSAATPVIQKKSKGVPKRTSIRKNHRKVA